MNRIEISRRQLLIGGAGAIGVGALAGFGLIKANEGGNKKATQAAFRSTSTPTLPSASVEAKAPAFNPTAVPTLNSEPIRTVAALASQTPEATRIPDFTGTPTPKATEAPVVAKAVKPTATPEAVKSVQGGDIIFNSEKIGDIKSVAVPKSLDDPDMKSYQLQLDTPKGVWFHPLFNKDLFDKAHNYGGAWSWGVSFMDQSDGAHLKTMGDPGRAIVRVNDDRNDATIIVGAMTAATNHNGAPLVNDYKTGNDPKTEARTINPNWTVGMWIRTEPGARIEVIDPDSGKPYQDKDGNSLGIVANEKGDAAILLPDNGRVAAKWTVSNPIPKQKFESIVWFGPHDKVDQQFTTNEIYMSKMATKTPVLTMK